ncbi:YHS domain-containing (seleno)protein [Rhodoplanes sp. TEM]|uniref:YHS domain-containing (Seleno)protein n=1 Tax=Rhodoplanes tepidamans TaxID=200616 RepID=A0ABT5J685_RHOTP|nr:MULTISPECIES: YHS domain-containing (seleno)protein [Rhodoplanes]MDC7785126.1 YHS domain-containing (seleno)protein [Rhodoplanes tepidamans]MDC7982600.1 YHS domain-containing (seleno)protein [Rhodoplanes sp. TEM]MDQ0356616.1 YHS domain-containing protein [Rhodoplanes tepidamans]
MLLFALVAGILGLALAPTSGLLAATTERVVTDRYSGLAIAGFDPVSYFVDGKAAPGRPEYEYVYQGTVWRFRNEGNRNAFADNPGVYAPLFGGYDPVGIARGISRPGHPEVFVVLRGRLMLFYSEKARDKFLADPLAVLTDAQSHWPELRAQLTP